MSVLSDQHERKSESMSTFACNKEEMSTDSGKCLVNAHSSFWESIQKPKSKLLRSVPSPLRLILAYGFQGKNNPDPSEALPAPGVLRGGVLPSFSPYPRQGIG